MVIFYFFIWKTQSNARCNRTLQFCREGEFQTGKLQEQLSSKSLELVALRTKYELITSALHLSQERVSILEERNCSLEEDLKSSQESATLEKTKLKEVSFSDLQFDVLC